MGKGILRLQVVSAEGAILVENARVIIMDENGQVVQQLSTDNTGHVPEISLAAPDKSLTETPFTSQRRYAVYDVQVDIVGYKLTIYKNVMIFDQSTSIQVIDLCPLTTDVREEVEILDVGGHALDRPQIPEPQTDQWGGRMPRILPEVIIPNYITVHLGRPEVWAPNVRVPFIDYIKVKC